SWTRKVNLMSMWEATQTNGSRFGLLQSCKRITWNTCSSIVIYWRTPIGRGGGNGYVTNTMSAQSYVNTWKDTEIRNGIRFFQLFAEAKSDGTSIILTQC